jgi:hypothetical protein
MIFGQSASGSVLQPVKKGIFRDLRISQVGANKRGEVRMFGKD